MTTKRINPYTALKNQFSAWATKVFFRRTKSMWTYPKSKLNDRWQLGGLYERVKAAEQIGYDVKLFATDAGLEVKYVEKLPERPFDI